MESKYKKVCFVIQSLHCGGAERVISELANYASEKSYNVHIISIHNVPSFYALNVNVKLHVPSFMMGKSRALYALRSVFFLRKKLKKINPHSVLSFGATTNPFVLLSTRFTKYPIYISDRGDPYAKNVRIDDFFRHQLYCKATGIIAQTQIAKEYMNNILKNNNVKVIPNPVRTIKHYNHKKEKIIVFLGRLIPSKGVNYLIQAFADLKQIDDWRVLIIGDGDQRKTLLDMSEKLEVNNKIEFCGNVTDVDYYLSKSEIFVFPSLSEGFPNALVEAMANSLACVSFDCISGPSEIINNGENGFLVEVGNVNQLRERLEELMLNTDLREKFQNKAHEIVDKLKKEVILQEYLDFILS